MQHLNQGLVPRVLVTLGEPAGVGPEIVCRLVQQAFDAHIIVVGDAELLQAQARAMRVPLVLDPFIENQVPYANGLGHVSVLHVPLQEEVSFGQLNVKNAQYVLTTLSKASSFCIKHKAALVTAPVQKSIINQAGISFTGHTEFFAQHANSSVVMLMVTQGLRVALVTTHLPLRKVADSITEMNLKQCIQILHQSLITQLGIDRPRIDILGLNPHAGENGYLGKEEIEIMIPCIQALKNQGMDLRGPLPADTAFLPDRLVQTDVILAMYHDQGLPVLKARGFGDAVNVTLGLPYVRTSVDHGTALDIAGRGCADASSLIAATQLAIEMSLRQKPKESAVLA